MLKTVKARLGTALRVSQILDALGSLAEQVGYPKVILGVGTMLITAWGYLSSTLPGWAIFLGACFIAALMLWAAKQIVVIRRSLAFKKLDLDILAKRLLDLSEKTFRFAQDMARDSLYALKDADGTEQFKPQSRAEWQRDIVARELVSLKFLEMSRGEIQALMLILKDLGIEIPHHISHLDSERNYRILAIFFAVIGRLLDLGCLDDARKITEDDWYSLLQ